MIIDFYTYNLKKALANEVDRAESAETALKTDTFADVEYDASGKTIDFYNGFDQKIASIDASDFVIDGMVENVTLSGTILTISFNTESGKQDIDIDLSSIINPELYWTSAETKTYVDNSLSGKQDTLISGTNIKTINGNSILGEGNIELDLSGYTTTAQTEEIERVTSRALNELHNSLSGKQETLVSGENIKTINGNSILGSGNIELDLSNYTTTAQTEELKNKLQVDEETVSKALNELHEDKADKTEIPVVPTSNTAFTNDAQYITIDDVKPVTIWEAPEGTNGFYAINNTGFTTWQIENVDLSAYKYVRFYIKASDLAFDSTTSEYTQAVYVDVLLDDVSINQNSPAYIGVHSTILPNNRNRSYTVIAAVDLTKTKLQLIYQTTLWDITVSAANNNGRYCYKIEGYKI